MLDYIACILVRALNLIFYLVPIRLSLWAGRRIGTVAFSFNKKRRLIAYANLKAAFGREKSPRELRAITKRVYQNLAQTFIEILNLTKVDKRYVERYVEIIHRERVQDASVSGRGTILLTAHFGDWELSGLTSAVIGFPILVLAREQKMRRLNELLNQLRESKGCKVIRKGMSIKLILRALYEKNIVGILSDQDAGRDGIFVDFFGRPTSTHIGPAQMAQRTDSLILPSFIVREHGPYHKVFLEEYIDFRTIKTEDDIKTCLQKFASILEAYIRRYPDQWLWLHKRWKSTPVRIVLVLDDGRAGHLNQSLAIASEIRRARSARGYSACDTRIVIEKVAYKSKAGRVMLGISSSLASWRCHGRMGAMRACLRKDTYSALMATYADFVVSCGASTEAVNIFMAIENNAKNIIVMKPRIFNSLSKFDLAVVPAHDRPVRRANVAVTTLSPNMVDDTLLREHGRRLGADISLDGQSAIALFIGGDNEDFILTSVIMEEVLDELVRFANDRSLTLLVTTSRRTSKHIEEIVKRRLSSEGRCKLLLIANEKNVEGAVQGMLSLCDMAIVSGESISMLSEAITSGKKVVAFTLQNRNHAITKHERVLSEFTRLGFIATADRGKLRKVLDDRWNAAQPDKILKDKEIIRNAVARLI